MRCLRSLWSSARPSATQNVPARKQLACLTSVPFTRPRQCQTFTTTSHLYNAPATSPTDSIANSFRSVMRHVPHPVVVITTLDCPTLCKENQTARYTARVPEHWADTEIPSTVSRRDELDNPEVLGPLPRAMTASSFTSLTLVPTPTVLFNISLPSRSYNAIIQSGSFNVHILSADEQGARVADLFARGYSGATSKNSTSRQDRLGMLSSLADYNIEVVGQKQWEDSWAALLKQDSTSGRLSSADMLPAPLLRGPGILHVIKCKLVDLQLTGSLEARHFALVAGQVIEVVAGTEPQDAADRRQTALSYVDGAYRGPSPAVMKHSTTSSSR